MRVSSRKSLNSAELETVRVSRNTTTLVTANGEVQTNEEATVYVYDLDLFVTVQILGDTPAVLSLRRSRTLIGVGQWSENTPFSKIAEKTMQHGKVCADRCPRIIVRLFHFDCKYISSIVTAGHN